MEKIIYVLWKKEGMDNVDFKNHLLNDVAKQILSLDVLKLSISIDDERVEPAHQLRQVNNVKPISGIISFWLDTAINRHPVEAVIEPFVDRFAGYLVTESVPIVNASNRVPLGKPTPGMSQVAFLTKPEDMVYDDWLKIWLNEHGKVGVETQSTFQYIQNVVVRSLTDDAPDWTGIVEEGFPEKAMTDQSVFFDAVGDPEKFEANLNRMLESVSRFLDISQLNVIPMSEYIIKE